MRILVTCLLLCCVLFAQLNPTPNLGLSRPPYQYPRYDIPLNANFDIIDNLVSMGTCGQVGYSAGTDAFTCPKVINGVAYSSLYPGATLDVRVNACIIDAETGANGAVSHICDSSGEGGIQTIAAQINVGDVANDPVTWRLPARCQWSTTINDGVSSAIKQFSLSRIDGTASPLLRCEIINGSGSNQVSSMYVNQGDGYYRASGFTLESKNVPLASGVVMKIIGAFDNSLYEDIEVLNYSTNGIGIQLGNTKAPCCSVSLNRITVNNNYTGGIPLDIQANASGIINGVYFFGGSFDHPAAGLPNIRINDTSTQHTSTLAFYGVYEEGNNADTTTPLNQITTAGNVAFYSPEFKAETASSTAPAFQLNGATATNFSVRDLALPLNFTLPATAVQNNINSTTVPTDAKGNLAEYTTQPAFHDSVSMRAATLATVTGSTQCVQVNSAGLMSGTGSPCGTGGTTITILSAYCGGVVGGGNGTAYTLAPAIQANSTACSQTPTQELAMPYAATASKLFVTAAVAGGVVGSGVVAIFKNGVATAVTCTLGTGLTCNDTTHSVAFAQGDTWSVRVTTGQASDTTQGVKAQFQYQ